MFEKSISGEALKSLRGQKDLCFPFSPGMDFDGHPVFLDAGKNILAGGVTGSGAASLACGLIVQSVSSNPENIPTLVLIDPQGIDLPVFEKLPNVYGQKVFRDVKEAEGILDELQTEILRRKSLLEEAAVKTFTEYNQIVSKTRVRMRQIVAVVYAFKSLRELFAEKFRIRKFCEKLKKLMETAMICTPKVGQTFGGAYHLVLLFRIACSSLCSKGSLLADAGQPYSKRIVKSGYGPVLIQISNQTADRGLRIRAKLFEHEPRPHKLTTGRSNNAGLRLEPLTGACAYAQSSSSTNPARTN